GEALVVLDVVGAQRSDVVQRAGLEAEQVVTLHQVGIESVLIDLDNDSLVEARRKHIDQFHARYEFAVLLGGHLAGYENAQMPDTLVHSVNDGLAVRDDLALVVI